MRFFRVQPVAPEAIRQAIFGLGNRHQGNALGGAWLELQRPGVTRDRRRVLEAVILHLTPDRRSRPARPTLVVPDVNPIGVAALAAIMGAAMCLVTMFFG